LTSLGEEEKKSALIHIYIYCCCWYTGIKKIPVLRHALKKRFPYVNTLFRDFHLCGKKKKLEKKNYIPKFPNERKIG
jgi:hypothetical protein